MKKLAIALVVLTCLLTGALLPALAEANPVSPAAVEGPEKPASEAAPATEPEAPRAKRGPKAAEKPDGFEAPPPPSPKRPERRASPRRRKSPMKRPPPPSPKRPERRASPRRRKSPMKQSPTPSPKRPERSGAPKRRKNPTPLKRPNPRTAMDAPARRIGITGKKGRRPVRRKGRRAAPVRMSGRGTRLRTAAGANRKEGGRIALAARMRMNAPAGRTGTPPNRCRTCCRNVSPAGKRRKRK